MHADEPRLNSLLSTRDHLEAFGPSSARGREWKRDRESGHLKRKVADFIDLLQKEAVAT